MVVVADYSRSHNRIYAPLSAYCKKILLAHSLRAGKDYYLAHFSATRMDTGHRHVVSGNGIEIHAVYTGGVHRFVLFGSWTLAHHRVFIIC